MKWNKELKPHEGAAILIGVFGAPFLIMLVLSGEANGRSLVALAASSGILFLFATVMFSLRSKFEDKLKNSRANGLVSKVGLHERQRHGTMKKKEADALYAEAVDAYNRGAFSEAAEALRPLMAQFPDNRSLRKAWDRVVEKLGKSVPEKPGQTPGRRKTEAEDCADSPVEVRTQRGERLSFEKMVFLRRKLLDGTVTRFDYVRERVEEPAQEERGYKVSIDARSERRKRRAWRQIGGSIAKECMSILWLYDPKRYYRKRALFCFTLVQDSFLKL